MSETAAWIPDELPAGREARELAEILAAPPTFAEREKARREQAERDAQRARAADTADNAEQLAFMARMRGQELPGVSDVLGRPEPGSADRERRQQAVQILRRYGLEDQITGGQSGCVLDANVGVLEPARDVARSAGDFDFETGQALQRAAENDRWMTGYLSRTRTVQRSGRPKGSIARSEMCQHCTDQGVSDEMSYLLHSDPELNVPVTPPGQAEADRREADRRWAEAERLMELGFSRSTALLAAVPYGEAVR